MDKSIASTRRQRPVRPPAAPGSLRRRAGRLANSSPLALALPPSFTPLPALAPFVAPATFLCAVSGLLGGALWAPTWHHGWWRWCSAVDRWSAAAGRGRTFSVPGTEFCTAGTHAWFGRVFSSKFLYVRILPEYCGSIAHALGYTSAKTRSPKTYCTSRAPTPIYEHIQGFLLLLLYILIPYKK
eukprot:SAG11_NODE_1707_length_4410_cov_12.577824_2_plen_184_part_00